MDVVLLEYIDTKEFGKIAHFVDRDGKNIYSKILNDGDTIYYQELTSDELSKIEDELN